jgi:drug/metabolite transporter (DMT)-like permease
MIYSASTLALMCLLASGLNDLVFKFYATKQRSRGMFVCGIGLVWFLLQLVYVYSNQYVLDFNQSTLIYGGAAAIAVTVSNILLLECLGHLPISMASTIYRLNTIPLVVLAFVFLGEDLGILKSAGIGVGLGAVLFFHRRSAAADSGQSHIVRFLILIIVASCVRALYGLFTKAGLNNNADADAMILLAAIGWCVGGLLYAGLREKRITITKDKLKFIPISGVLVFSIVWLLTKALTLGDASVVVPLANMGFIAAFIFSVGLGLEALDGKKITAIICAVISIALLTASS